MTADTPTPARLDPPRAEITAGLPRRIDADGYVEVLMPDHHRADSRGYVLEHVVIAEHALGKPLPPEAVVHHANEEKKENRRGNLVICQDRTYHFELHMRMKARDACGRPSWRKCKYCKRWDALENLRFYVHRDRKRGQDQTRYFHEPCRKEAHRRYYRKRKAAHATG